LVSGRSIADLDHLFRPLRLPAAGQHGGEVRLAPDGSIALVPCEPIGPALRQEIAALAHAYPGVQVEDKGQTLAVHYRARSAAGEPVARALAGIVARNGGRFGLVRGKMVIELRDHRHSKASAVDSFMAVRPFAGRRPIFLGDDITDEDGFATVERLNGVAMPVGRSVDQPGGRGREAVFASPAEVRDWLAALSQRLRASNANAIPVRKSG
jgi:trehalose 6-phosphate phosphatase